MPDTSDCISAARSTICELRVLKARVRRIGDGAIRICGSTRRGLPPRVFSQTGRVQKPSSCGLLHVVVPLA